MSYETIILELMSRIKSLEDDVAQMKETIASLSVSPSTSTEEPEKTEFSYVDTAVSTPRNASSRVKMTQAMMDTCYAYGKTVYQDAGASAAAYAAQAAQETGMNQGSAFIYILAVKNLLSGTVFKRGISIPALRHYLSLIQAEFGMPGLTKALQATKATIAYRDSCHIPSDSMIALCKEFEAKL